MSRIEPAKFSVEEFPEQADWIEKFFIVLNGFTNDVVTAFTNSITIDDNLFQEIKEIKFVNSAVSYPMKFKTKFNIAPKGLFYIYLFNNTIGAYSVLAPHVVWSYANNPFGAILNLVLNFIG